MCSYYILPLYTSHICFVHKINIRLFFKKKKKLNLALGVQQRIIMKTMSSV